MERAREAERAQNLQKILGNGQQLPNSPVDPFDPQRAYEQQQAILRRERNIGAKDLTSETNQALDPNVLVGRATRPEALPE